MLVRVLETMVLLMEGSAKKIEIVRKYMFLICLNLNLQFQSVIVDCGWVIIKLFPLKLLKIKVVHSWDMMVFFVSVVKDKMENWTIKCILWVMIIVVATYLKNLADFNGMNYRYGDLLLKLVICTQWIYLKRNQISLKEKLIVLYWVESVKMNQF